MKKPNKAKRTALAKRQNNICPICTGLLPEGKGKQIYEPDHNTMICWECSAFRRSLHSSLKRGVTPAMVSAYDISELQPDPAAPRPVAQTTAKAKPKAKGPSYEQLLARWEVATGRRSFGPGLAGHDERTRITGPVMHPDTREPIGIMEYSSENRTYGASLGG